MPHTLFFLPPLHEKGGAGGIGSWEENYFGLDCMLFSRRIACGKEWKGIQPMKLFLADPKSRRIISP